MVSRCVALLLCVVAAHAVTLDHKDAATNAALTHASKSEFGQTVLAQLQDKITEGSPADELNKIIQEIRDRLTQAGLADDAQWAAFDAQALAEKESLEDDIATQNSDITGKEADIEQTEAEIYALTDAIASYEDKIIRDQEVIDEIDQEISNNDYEWEADKKLFANRTADTNLCLEALDDIEKILADNKNLAAGQDETAADYQNKEIYDEKIPTMLEKLSKNVNDPTVVSFIQATSLALQTLSKGDVDNLSAMLKDLAEKLNLYKAELVTDNEKNEAAYKEKTTALGLQRAAAVDTLESDKKTKAAKEAARGAKQQELKDLDADLVTMKTYLEALDRELAAQEQKRVDLQAAYDARTTDRNDELGTLADIQQIIDEKLGGSLQSHIQSNLTTDVGGDFE